MRLDMTIRRLRARLRQPLNWIVPIAIPVLLGVLATLLQSLFHARAGWFLRFSMGMSILALLGLWASLVSPLAWQWTGDGRSDAGFGRGAFQSTVLALLGACFLMLLVMAARFGGGRPLAGAGLFKLMRVSFATLFGFQAMGYFIARWERLVEETRRSKARAREWQWMSHRGAFSPALLFNNLTFFSSRVVEDPRGTEEALLDLADLYRKWLMEAEEPLIPWGRERAITEQFLALEARRWGSRLKVRWSLEPELESQLVPPLIVIPFLEASLAGAEGEGLDLDISAVLQAGSFDILIRLTPSCWNLPKPLFAQISHRIASLLGSKGGAFLEETPSHALIRLRLPLLEPGGRP